MDPSRSRYDAGDECDGHLPRSVGSAVFGRWCGPCFESAVGISIAELAIPTYIRHVIAPEFVDHRDVSDDVFVAAQVDILEPYVACSCGAVFPADLGSFTIVLEMPA